LPAKFACSKLGMGQHGRSCKNPSVQSAALASLAAQVGLSDVDLQKALAGEVPARSESFTSPSGKAAGRGLGAIVIARPLRDVWSTLARFEDRPEYVPRLKAIQVLEREPQRVRVLQIVDAGLTSARTTLWFSLDEAERCISWQLDKSAKDNSVVEVTGDYRMLECAPERTLLAYRAHIDTGLRIPLVVQQHLQKRAVPELLRAIKSRVESGGTWKR
jgi:carbon monoxide dehydrogenase subunit G